MAAQLSLSVAHQPKSVNIWNHNAEKRNGSLKPSQNVVSASSSYNLSFSSSVMRSSHVARAAVTQEIVDVEVWNKNAKQSRLAHLEAQAIEALQTAISNFERPTFPCALIAGDVVILDLLHKIGAFKNPKLSVVFIDTFHLFDETYTFLAECEERYGFKAKVFHAAGFNTKAEYEAKHGRDLFIVDIDEYDRICKVEPFGRALKTLQVDVMINGRRRDHGAERAHLELFESGTMAKVQPLAYWEFRDCFDYLESNGVPAHPLHAQGYPSIGDVPTTIPVPREKWFEYGGERSGRFQGLTNKDGSTKTECGIHVGDAREVAEE